MQGVLIDDHRIHVDFSQSVRAAPTVFRIYAELMYRYLGFQTPGETQQIQSVLKKEVALGASLT